MRHWIAATAVFASADAHAQTAPSAAAVAQAVRTTYASVQTFEADFDEQVDEKSFATKVQRRGHVSFAGGGKMRWDYTTPAGDVVVSDGTTLYSYEAARNVAYQMAPQRSGSQRRSPSSTGTSRVRSS